MAVTKVVMPKLSEAMETGKLLRWLKQEGDRITRRRHRRRDRDRQGRHRARGLRLGRAPEAPGASRGPTVPVGDLIAVIAEPDEDISALVGGGAPGRRAARRPAPGAPAPPRPRRLRPRRGAAPAAHRAGSGRAGARGAAGPRGQPAPPLRRAAAPAAAAGAPAPAPRRRGREAPAAPVQAAAASGLAAGPEARPAGRASICHACTGTGPGGRIIQRDVEAFRGAPGGRAAPAARRRRPPGGGPDRPEAEDVPLSPDPRGHRPADGAVQGPGPALLHHHRDRHGAGGRRCARRSRRSRAPQASRSPTSSSAPAR